MDNWIAAALLVCSNGDPETAKVVVEMAQLEGVDPALALAIACTESGIRGRNVLGVRACYPGKNNGRFDQTACIAIGIASIKSKKCSDACIARRYNNTGHRHAYAKKVVRLAAVIRRNK